MCLGSVMNLFNRIFLFEKIYNLGILKIDLQFKGN